MRYDLARLRDSGQNGDMRTAGIFEAKQNFSSLIDAVEAGEEVRITRHGKEIVRMLPVKRVVITDDQIDRELDAIDALHARVKPGPGWQALRDEGRE
jgi:prevent-host-death family protein